MSVVPFLSFHHITEEKGRVTDTSAGWRKNDISKHVRKHTFSDTLMLIYI